MKNFRKYQDLNPSEQAFYLLKRRLNIFFCSVKSFDCFGSLALDLFLWYCSWYWIVESVLDYSVDWYWAGKGLWLRVMDLCFSPWSLVVMRVKIIVLVYNITGCVLHWVYTVHLYTIYTHTRTHRPSCYFVLPTGLPFCLHSPWPSCLLLSSTTPIRNPKPLPLAPPLHKISSLNGDYKLVHSLILTCWIFVTFVSAFGTLLLNLAFLNFLLEPNYDLTSVSALFLGPARTKTSAMFCCLMYLSIRPLNERNSEFLSYFHVKLKFPLYSKHKWIGLGFPILL